MQGNLISHEPTQSSFTSSVLEQNVVPTVIDVTGIRAMTPERNGLLKIDARLSGIQ
jgi:hypothetical protein